MAALADGPPRDRRRAGRARRRRPAWTRRAWPTSPPPSAVRDDLAGAVVGDAGTALQAATTPRSPGPPRSPGAATRRASGGRARRCDATIDRLRDRVTLLAPADGTYSLASSDAPLVLTVQQRPALRRRGAARASGPAATAGCPSATSACRRWRPAQRTTLQVPTAGAAVRRLRGHRPADDARRRPARRARADAGEEHRLRLDLADHHDRRGGAAGPALPAPAGATSCCAAAPRPADGRAAPVGHERRPRRRPPGARCEPATTPRRAAPLATPRRRTGVPPARPPRRSAAPPSAAAAPRPPAPAAAALPRRRPAPPRPSPPRRAAAPGGRRRRPPVRRRAGRRRPAAAAAAAAARPLGARRRRRHPGHHRSCRRSPAAGRRGPRRTAEPPRGRAGRQPAASCGPPGRWPSRRWSPGSPGCCARWCSPPRSASALVNDAYNTANTLPNIVYELLLGGVLDLGRRPAAGARPGAGPRRRRRPTPSGWSPIATAGLVRDDRRGRAGRAAADLGCTASAGTPTRCALANWLARHPAGGDRLLRPRRAGARRSSTPGASSARPAWAPVLNNVVVIATGALFIAASGPGDLDAGHDHARPGLAARHRHDPRHRRAGAGPAAAARPGRRAAAAPLGAARHRPARGRHPRASG